MKVFKVLLVIFVTAAGLQACSPRPTGPEFDETPTQPPDIILATETPTPIAPLVELTPIPLKTGFGFRSPWLELYFTDPYSPFAAEKTGGVDGPVGASIGVAKQSIDVALNSLSIDNITKALIRAHNRGIQVRVVMESDYLENSDPVMLSEAGIPIVGDQRDGLMHNEFIIIDNNRVWTGSTNFTDTEVYKNYNSLVNIYSEEIAQSYTTEFEEMFQDDQFGTDVNPSTPFPSVDIAGTQVEVLFSPDDIVATRLAALISEAQESIYFMAPSLGLEDLGAAIRQQALAGITVVGVMEDNGISSDQPEQVSEYSLFREAGLDVRLHNDPSGMNHKVIIIDRKIVVMGSYDFVYSSEVINDENVLIIHNDKVAEKFMEEFLRVQSRAEASN